MGLSFTFDLDLSPLLARFEGAPAAIRPGVEKGVYRHELAVLARSLELVPIGGPPTSPHDPAPGTLRASGVALPPVWDGDRCIGVIGFGGAASDYAARQHEDLTYQHKDGQQAKYLEQPFDEEAPQLLGRIADGMQEG